MFSKFMTLNLKLKIHVVLTCALKVLLEIILANILVSKYSIIKPLRFD